MTTYSPNEESLADYIASQDSLIQEAAEALPHQFSQCTFPLGHLRQAVYLCLTCAETSGICSACSIACHTNHEQIELFPKRNFRCDCPTEAIAHPCSLHTIAEPVNELNQYGQNFKALFCRCKRPYDAATEKETMIQCLACEDWFHESCCNLRERPNPEDIPPENPDHDPTGNEDADSEASNDLPPALIGPEDYDAFICGGCVLQAPILQRYAGTTGCLVVVRDSPTSPWKTLADSHTDVQNLSEVSPEPEPANDLNRNKRAPSPTGIDSSITKKTRLSPTSFSSTAINRTACVAPIPNETAQNIFADLKIMTDPSFALGTGDIFLTGGFRNRWCRCSSCSKELEIHPYLLEEEETYEPPEDPDSASTLEELGMRALSRLPRERAIDGIHAFNAMRDDLVQYLRPFAQEGKVVNEVDVRNFFDRLLEEQRARRESS
ncbi:hypothetical protein EV361DRAFT_887810 [Lentinula raphanica]|uniref:UBR-type domain-containing protein n=1 Tax=Lentinula raphanica TaxID=153919 RepID=A0AA38PJI9_9AGAR|nr:hypothetical protein C8R42DRAFT_670552 [Lentinula raphanica]KAJ3776222.1 hypothetical protein FB446DRAFT_763012 [Lentinula raphanica]KAJ3821483.1 hypothetical protein F5880DRAFT_1581747 [Lentinula raphanica]KAJ3844119.1 hypothetical protein F5878DRAFT_602940 [Lentinula raphanica]KAJ3975647.1 hypothetical protein EV361DRAFT_887810 [Lentinula raphanica]